MIIVLLLSTVVGGALAFVMLQMLMPPLHDTLPRATSLAEPAPAHAAQAAPAAPAHAPAPAAAPAPVPAHAPSTTEPATPGMPGAAARTAAPPVAVPAVPMADLKPFVVTLNDPGSPRYMKINLKVELDSASAQQEMAIREAEIRDRLILYLSSLTLAKTKGIRAKQQIRSNVVHRVNTILKKGRVSRVFISEFITQ